MDTLKQQHRSVRFTSRSTACRNIARPTASRISPHSCSARNPHVENDPGRFHKALATSIDAMQLFVDPEIARRAFVEAAPCSRMHILPDEMDELKASD